MLSVVSTPIGNLEDITLRALKTLKEADSIVAEDTRHTAILLQKYEISRPLLSFHAHSTQRDEDRLLGLLAEGKHLALVSDAGTPGISDPGYRLITRAIAAGFPLTVIPGPTALAAAATLSGLPAHRFLFLGFLPLKKGRKKLLASLREAPFAIVLYEAPHRLLKTLSELKEFLPGRRIAICREMTKVFEECFRGTIEEALERFSAKPPKGEFTLVLGPVSLKEQSLRL